MGQKLWTQQGLWCNHLRGAWHQKWNGRKRGPFAELNAMPYGILEILLLINFSVPPKKLIWWESILLGVRFPSVVARGRGMPCLRKSRDPLGKGVLHRSYRWICPIVIDEMSGRRKEQRTQGREIDTAEAMWEKTFGKLVEEFNLNAHVIFCSMVFYAVLVLVCLVYDQIWYTAWEPDIHRRTQERQRREKYYQTPTGWNILFHIIYDI